MSYASVVTLLINIATQETAEYIFLYKGFEVHLIDTPGFDDDGLDDARILNDIANRINFIYKDGVKISGVLYLHDITKARMGGTGQRNIRLLEAFLGCDHWNRSTLVTTKWGCTTDPAQERLREEELENSEKFWKAMRTSTRKAEMKRFANTQESALEIIEPYLTDGFVPKLTYEMADPAGPQHPLGSTAAGHHISEYLNKLEKQRGRTAQTEQARRELEQRYNEEIYLAYQKERKRMEAAMAWKRGGRWTLRLVTLGGCIAGTVLTLGAASPAFAAVPLVEAVVQAQKENDKEKLVRLKHKFRGKFRQVKTDVSTDSLDAFGQGSSSDGKYALSLYESDCGSFSDESLFLKPKEDDVL